MKQKIILTIILISMAVSTVLSAVFYMRSVEVIENNYVKSVTSSLTVCAGTFDDMMKEAYYTAVHASTDSELQQWMQRADEASRQALLQRLADYRIGNIDSVYCYLAEQNCMIKATKVENMIQQCSEEDVLWLEELSVRQENPLSPLYVTDQTALIKKQIFTYVKPVCYPESGRELGYVIASIDERDVFFGCLQGHGHSDDGISYLATPDNRIASGSNLNLLGQDQSRPEENMLITVVTSPLSGYQLATVADRSVITGDIKRTRNEILVLALLLNLLFCIPVLIIVRNMMRPLQHLEGTMEQVSQGDLTARAEIYHADEIGRLSEGFNTMICQIEDLIEELVTQKMLKKEAEIEALKYQITPHFMYNTLNSIKYAAILQNSSEIAELLEAFIELLQLSASDRGAFIPMRQELHMVRNYTRLQLFRYANSFEVNFDVSPEVEDCYVPSLLIQPLVENAILHGIDLKKPGGRIMVRALIVEGNTLAIKVEDNGKGMTAEDLRQLMSGQRRSKFSGIGVRNVRERLDLYYGKSGKLEFYAQNGCGTSAVITLPVSRDAEEYTI
ncbi:MAG: histidine kinase [Butyricicoccaceae bacterium]